MGSRRTEAAIPVHHTGTTTGSWDSGANVRRIPATATASTLRAEYAWVDPDKDAATKAAYKLPHHEVSSAGAVGAASVKACQAGIAALNGARGGVNIPTQDRQAVYSHLAAHLKDADVAPADLRSAEAMIDGQRSHADTRELVRDALMDRLRTQAGTYYAYVGICDMTDDQVVYTSLDDDDLFQCSYSVDAAGAVALGEPKQVVRTYADAPVPRNQPPEPPEDMAATEAAGVRVQMPGRVLEAKGTGADGGRIFGVRLIAYGDSLNGRRYPEAVMRAAAPLYEGAKAFDRHRSDEDMSSGSTVGLVGQIRAVTAEAEGLEGELHLLPSATHAAEALDASLAAEADDLPPLVGMSHDVMATFRPISEGGQRLMEATAISKVLSTDVVSDPAAGGRAMRAVAGGIAPIKTKESDVGPTTADVLSALKGATAEDLAAVGLARAATESKTTETTTPQADPARTVETGQPKDSILGRMLIREAVTGAGLPAAVIEGVTAALPDRITEAAVDAQIAGIKSAMGLAERAGLTPTVTATVTKEATEKKIAALDAMFAGDYSKGYRSFREAFVDITGRRPKAWDEDFNRTILRESVSSYDSARVKESLVTDSWDVILGDSVTRRMVADYNQPSLQTWRLIVSSMPPINDFRTQRIDRLGGYGTLPAVAQGAAYQPLTSPGDEEVTYSITKRGGTEDLTLEMIANDDLRAIANIPRRLGLAAAQTLYRFVFDILTVTTNIYDAHALFDSANHANTDTGAALSQSTLSTARRKMRQQKAFGDTKDVLSIMPRFIVVPAELEEIAYQLVSSAVAIPATPAGPTDTPNIHQGMTHLVVPYYTDANDWFVVADPNMIPTIEVGFYQGRQQPELFTQSDPNVGSMFDNDTITYKIRHIYSGAVLDYRGFYRGQG